MCAYIDSAIEKQTFSLVRIQTSFSIRKRKQLIS